MLIDFHTHIFPERIAERALMKLTEGIKNTQGYEILSPNTDGTLDGLRRSMKENCVDISVVMPIATTTGQSKSINAFAKEITSEDVISFGSLHPYQEDADSVLEGICEMGLRGIKLHPEFQGFFADEPVIFNIVKRAKSLGLFVTFHCGVDYGFHPPVRCTPERLARIIEKTGGENMICAHLGSFLLWEDVYKLIAGSPVYMDMSMTSGYIDKGLFRDIIKKHGADKILFGSDSPWQSPSQSLALLSETALTEEEKELIKYKNALQILKGGE